jgi:predicted metalloprotease with PDZ domain
MKLNSIIAMALCLSAACMCLAQEVPKPVDRNYPGIIELHVDATNVAQKIFKMHERIPVKPGPITLLYPQWLLGAHAPADGALAQLAGLTLSAAGHPVEWQRDPLNMHAFHATLPAGVSTLEADFVFLSPLEGSEGAIVMTPEMLAVHWQALVLYPAGYFAHGVMVQPTVVFPQNWRFAGALEHIGPLGEQNGQPGAEARFKAVNLEELIDSPLYAGKYFKRIDLDPGAKVPVFLDMVADSPEGLNGSPQQIDAHRALVQQAYKLFGSHHYDHYDFLMALSDDFSFAGLEHHQSGENGVRTTYFSDWDHQQSWRSNLVSHEFTHSWDGKFRRPADQLTANFNLPMQDSLLWVYEGATSYWGHVLGARSGLVETAQMREGLAATAALYDHRVGRSWRSLADTTNEPIINQRRPLGWMSFQRAEDYYSEGELIWLDVDTKIRELSEEKRSLDDWARSFFGVQNGRHQPLGYTFKDVVASLNAVQPYDWQSFLSVRLEGHGPGAPLAGITRAGWKLAYGDTPTSFSKDVEAYRKVADFYYSIGINLDSNGRVVDVLWNSPAFKAGLSQGFTVIAINGKAYKPELLKSAISTAKVEHQAIELLLRQAERYQTARIDYYDGLKYPRLERIEGTPDRLETIFRPLP